MEEKKKYSIWLIPRGDTYTVLANIISQLSEKYSAPSFEPHVTLFGQIIDSEVKAIEKTASLAKILVPYDIRFSEITYLDDYFQCLFLKVANTNDVMAANTRAREVFKAHIEDRNYAREYMPHLSLLYGNFSVEVKERIIKEIGKKWDAKFSVQNIHLFCTTGEVEDWRRIREFAFGKSS